MSQLYHKKKKTFSSFEMPKVFQNIWPYIAGPFHVHVHELYLAVVLTLVRCWHQELDCPSVVSSFHLPRNKFRLCKSPERWDNTPSICSPLWLDGIMYRLFCNVKKKWRINYKIEYSPYGRIHEWNLPPWVANCDDDQWPVVIQWCLMSLAAEATTCAALAYRWLMKFATIRTPSTNVSALNAMWN